MKTLLIALISIVVILLILCLPIDIIQSNIPSWKGVKVPNFLGFSIVGLFNFVIPVLFYFKLKAKVESKIIIAYFLIINILYLLIYFWPKNYIQNGSLDYEAYANYVYLLAGIFISALFIHLLFYLYALIKLVKKAASNSGLAQ